MSMDESEMKRKVYKAFARDFTCGPQMLKLNPKEPVMYFLARKKGAHETVIHEADLRPSINAVYSSGESQDKIGWYEFMTGSSGKQRELTKEEHLLQERMRVFSKGVSSYAMIDSLNKLVVPTPGCLDLFDIASPDASVHTNVWHDQLEARMDSKLSPDGKLVAYANDGDLWLLPVGASDPIKITHFHETNKYQTAGIAGFNLQEEFDQYSGFWWSPVATSTSNGIIYRILYTVEDETEVEEYSIPTGEGDGVDVYKYPRTGTKNGTVELRVVTIIANEKDVSLINSVAVDQTFGGRFNDVEYIVRAGWTANGNQVWLQLLDRRQQHVRLVLLDVDAFGKDKVSYDSLTTVIEEKTSIWINITDACRSLSDGTFLWASEETGFRQLYSLYPVDASDRHGKWAKRQLTARSGSNPELLVCGNTDEITVDEKNKIILFVATTETPLRHHVCAVSYADGANPMEVVRVTPLEYFVDTFTARFYSLSSEGGEKKDVFVVAATMSNVNSGQGFVHVSTVDVALSTVVDLGNLYTKEESELSKGWITPEFFKKRSTRHGETLYGMIFMPETKGDAKVPVMVDIYGGPHVQYVKDVVASKFVAKRQFLCSLGYAVVVVDNVGSDNRGLTFEGHMREKMGCVEIADQVEMLEYAATMYNIDLKRVGICGWSYGGYMTLLALAQRPDVFRFAFSGAPVTMWEAYDTGYTERYMGIPSTEEAAYRASSVVACADRFPREPGRLLIAHGEQDENVHFEHTKTLIDKFDALGIPYELHTYPGEHHGVRSWGNMNSMFTTFGLALLKALPVNP